MNDIKIVRALVTIERTDGFFRSINFTGSISSLEDFAFYFRSYYKAALREVSVKVFYLGEVSDVD